MGLISRLLSKTRTRQTDTQKPDLWPNIPNWAALKNGVTVQTDKGPRFLWTVACGELLLPSGRLVACDPFVFLEPSNNPHEHRHFKRHFRFTEWLEKPNVR
jgi:hypothetical protein